MCFRIAKDFDKPYVASMGISCYKIVEFLILGNVGELVLRAPFRKLTYASFKEKEDIPFKLTLPEVEFSYDKDHLFNSFDFMTGDDIREGYHSDSLGEYPQPIIDLALIKNDLSSGHITSVITVPLKADIPEGARFYFNPYDHEYVSTSLVLDFRQMAAVLFKDEKGELLRMSVRDMIKKFLSLAKEAYNG